MYLLDTWIPDEVGNDEGEVRNHIGVTGDDEYVILAKARIPLCADEIPIESGMTGGEVGYDYSSFQRKLESSLLGFRYSLRTTLEYNLW